MEIQAPLRRPQTINAYNAMIIDRAMRGWQPYFANFMFDHIPGKKRTKFEIMEGEVERVYATLITHVVRRPNAPSQMEYRPVFVGCPDAPVAKSNKPSIRVHLANDGWHFNGCLLLPPPDKCRMKGHLDEHFRQHKDHYYIPDRPLNCVHVTRMSSPAIADYTFKHYKRGNVASGDILLLPRSRDEISARPKSNTVNSSVMSTAACGSKCSEKNRMGKIEKAKESAEESQVHPGY